MFIYKNFEGLMSVCRTFNFYITILSCSVNNIHTSFRNSNTNMNVSFVTKRYYQYTIGSNTIYTTSYSSLIICLLIGKEKCIILLYTILSIILCRLCQPGTAPMGDQSHSSLGAMNRTAYFFIMGLILAR